MGEGDRLLPAVALRPPRAPHRMAERSPAIRPMRWAPAAPLPGLGGLVPALLPALRRARGPGPLRLPAAPGHGPGPGALRGSGRHGHLVLPGGPGPAPPGPAAPHRGRGPPHRPPRPDPPPGLRDGPAGLPGGPARRQGPDRGPLRPARGGLPGPGMEPARPRTRTGGRNSAELGFAYDSSRAPLALMGDPRWPRQAHRLPDGLWELPPPVLWSGPVRCPLWGWGLRVLPFGLLRRALEDLALADAGTPAGTPPLGAGRGPAGASRGQPGPPFRPRGGAPGPRRPACGSCGRASASSAWNPGSKGPDSGQEVQGPWRSEAVAAACWA